MKTLTILAIIVFGTITLNAQSKSTTAADYNGTIQYAVSETNAAFPFVFTVVTETYDRGKLVSTETDIAERQNQGVERETKALVRAGKTLRSYSLMLGFGNHTYCSFDGVSWKGPQEYVCLGPDRSETLMIQGPRDAESVQYSVTESTLKGKPVKLYRKYAVFAASETNGKKTFEDETATIDSRGFFLSVVKTEGSLAPKTVTKIMKEAWDFETKIKPVTAPK